MLEVMFVLVILNVRKEVANAACVLKAVQKKSTIRAMYLSKSKVMID